jgi:hypothetical protein
MASETEEIASVFDLCELYSALNQFIEEPNAGASPRPLLHCSFSEDKNSNIWGGSSVSSKKSLSDLFPVPEPVVNHTVRLNDVFTKKSEAIFYFQKDRNTSQMIMNTQSAQNELIVSPGELNLKDIKENFSNLKLNATDKTENIIRSSLDDFSLSHKNVLQKRESFTLCETTKLKVNRSKNSKQKSTYKKDDYQQKMEITPKKIKTNLTVQIHRDTDAVYQMIKSDEISDNDKQIIPDQKKKNASKIKTMKYERCRSVSPCHSEADSSLQNSLTNINLGDSKELTKSENEIYEAIIMVFETHRLSHNLKNSLDEFALTYMKEILKKKFFFEDNFQIFVLKKIKRRSEETFKFVIKKAFRHMFKSFKLNYNGIVTGIKLRCEFEFYRFYFGKHAERIGEPLEEFFLPGSKIQKQFHKSPRKPDKTVSFAYLQKIFKNDTFRKEFINYLSNYFVPEYIKMRDTKIKKLSSKFTRGCKPKGNKLPWTNEEIAEAQKNLIAYTSCFD